MESTVAAGALFLHPGAEFRLLAAAGSENRQGHDEFVVRVGAAYDINVSGWTLSPTVNVDFLDSNHENWVYGMALGRGF